MFPSLQQRSVLRLRQSLDACFALGHLSYKITAQSQKLAVARKHPTVSAPQNSIVYVGKPDM